VACVGIAVAYVSGLTRVKLCGFKLVYLLAFNTWQWHLCARLASGHGDTAVLVSSGLSYSSAAATARLGSEAAGGTSSAPINQEDEQWRRMQTGTEPPGTREHRAGTMVLTRRTSLL
jgi:hypothetical protein